ncbi:DUF5690 family protein [Dinghuibacter silviterrae]|uniref:MFS transporter n=1 Tax=Dinghuibacter silviterrae TaxID=1539049 RepID=A0A4R8DFC5_9BACT|nr:DUF5690 family protein [Dinghuibacter silviterrae]TDW95786.1 hypothetical protein EDB95_3597 [Dinghuibacter silviterrae]
MSLRKLYSHPAWVTIAAFGTYFCMYGFRKPYTAATYAHSAFLHLDYKVLLVISQTLGYALAKWIGIKVVSEATRGRRLLLLVALIALAEVMLLLFGATPRPWNIVCLLLDGLCLGIVYGLVLGFLEGRRNTEALVAGLCTSFILADGVTKTVGSLLLQRGVPENWMPACAGALFLVPTLLFIGMLSRVPAPSMADIAHRSERVPMPAAIRRRFFRAYAPGMTGIVLIYLFVTLLRGLRADFAPEIWKGLGYRQDPALFTQSELLVSLGVLVTSGLTIYMWNHYRAFRFSLLSGLTGFILLPLSVWALVHGLDKFTFMVLIGLGVYLPYVAVHTTLIERLMPLTRERGTSGFLMYVADSVGYTGYILLMLFRYLAPPGESILHLLLRACLVLGVAGAGVVLFTGVYFHRRFAARPGPVPVEAAVA